MKADKFFPLARTLFATLCPSSEVDRVFLFTFHFYFIAVTLVMWLVQGHGVNFLRYQHGISLFRGSRTARLLFCGLQTPSDDIVILVTKL